jgi:hypothetical protein
MQFHSQPRIIKHYRVILLTPYETDVALLPVTVDTRPRAGAAGAYIGGGRKTPLRVGWGMGATAIENGRKNPLLRYLFSVTIYKLGYLNMQELFV